MLDNYKDIISTVAPGLATALGGPLAGMATQAITSALWGGEAPNQEVIAETFNAPDTLLKLKEIEAQLKSDLKKANIDLERIAADDRDSARARQIATRDLTPTILGTVVVAGFFGTLFYLFQFGMPEAGEKVLHLMLGALATMTSQITNYFFGSSVGSKSKDNVIAALKGK